jgi:3-oxoacyl-[acyl-carrier-protein] synthase II
MNTEKRFVMHRVVVTGMGLVCPLGNDVSSALAAMESGRSAVRHMDEWSLYRGLRTQVGAPADLVNEKEIPRKNRRSMSRMSLFAAQASRQALTDARLGERPIGDARLGCSIGSTMGSAIAINETFEIMLPHHDLSCLPSTQFFRCVSHTAAMNVAQLYGIRGMVVAPCAACASSLQAIGTACDWIRLGRQDRVLCGGAEELHPTVAGSFDVLFATSTAYNDRPADTPRPFDAERDGLVCGEGAGVLLLENRDLALARGATIYAEIVGYHTCGSGDHVSQSNRNAMTDCIRQTLAEAEWSAQDVDYVNAHATATRQGDAEEAQAIRAVFGDRVPVSSFKGHMGHTLGASGAMELILSIAAARSGLILPTRNLDKPDPDCQGLDHVLRPRRAAVGSILKNNFAFGGINAALACRLNA